jgi:hypothetical protein
MSLGILFLVLDWGPLLLSISSESTEGFRRFAGVTEAGFIVEILPGTESSWKFQV